VLPGRVISPRASDLASPEEKKKAVEGRWKKGSLGKESLGKEVVMKIQATAQRPAISRTRRGLE